MISLLAALVASAAEPPAEALAAAHQQAAHAEQTGMLVLGGWATVNIAGGLLGATLADDPAWRAFHQGNAAWNAVNLGIAVPGYVSARRRLADEPPPWPALPSALERRRAVYLLNLGLDVGYIGVGSTMLALAPEDDRLRGYGQSLVLQGAFLAGLDLSLAQGLGRGSRSLQPWLSPTGVGLAGRL